MKNINEKIMKVLCMAAASISILSVLLVCIFLFANGIPTIGKIGVFRFLFGTQWKPSSELFGILPMIVGSIYVTAGAIVFGVPMGLLCAVFMSRYCPKKAYGLIKSAIELLAGIPSIVYGFFGLVVIVPLMKNIFGGSGKSMLTASVLLGIMILPTVISVTEAAVRAVPEHYYEGALALGATRERSIFFVVLPAAKSGILAAVVLGTGRAIGETMAVVMVEKNTAMIPHSLVDGVRTMTANIVLEMGYAADLHREALIATAVVLFVFVLIINVSFSLLKRREK